MIRFILNNTVGYFFMGCGILYAYASMGFRAGMLCAAEMMKKDLQS
jgi:hypothetical protein